MHFFSILIFLNFTLFASAIIEQTDDLENKGTSDSAIYIAPNLPWDITKHIEKLAKNYIESCKEKASVKIDKSSISTLFSADPPSKKCIIEKPLAWVAEKIKETELYIDTLMNQREEYLMYISIFDEVQATQTTDLSDDEKDALEIKQTNLSIWLSSILGGTIGDKERAFPSLLAPQIQKQKDLLLILQQHYEENLEQCTSKEELIAFIFKNADSTHLVYFETYRARITQHIIEVYYPDEDS